MTIKKFDKSNLKALRESIDAALAKVNEEHGVKLTISNISFSENEFTTRLTGVIGSYDKPAEEFKSMATLYGGKPEWLGKTFTCREGKFKVLGLMSNKRTKPFLLERENGKRVLAPVEFLTLGFK